MEDYFFRIRKTTQTGLFKFEIAFNGIVLSNKKTYADKKLCIKEAIDFIDYLTENISIENNPIYNKK